MLCWLPVYFSVIMGQTTSTPLSLMTNHFSDFKSRVQNLSLLMKKSKLVTFCSAEWPAFDVGWPQEGTFSLREGAHPLPFGAPIPNSIHFGLAGPSRKPPGLAKTFCFSAPHFPSFFPIFSFITSTGTSRGSIQRKRRQKAQQQGETGIPEILTIPQFT